MTKWVTVYEKENTEIFLMDLLKYLTSQSNYYRIENITVEKTEKETKYTVDILFFNQKNEGKVYISKKTGDDDKQITTTETEKDKEVK
ncbi:hypothetical protein A2V49_03210 [candidate division WWE3 bacterium RBG_19FT_COMBO_34_6]|uniref:Uncharacterized protein n=1 Tax=candidate division WWE3 bacterium RBG_19FT_COMBO_34_6 TaxID=1802612 RepID=A0A1F4UKM3_UNCKA|nr:MAG: hypothetical protein A2V49_03210 [candidate division WWE3 bacterium RBG_19FT_COMBO_34_6]